ncbi:MAG: hypothetical protein A2Z91_09470 [Deltaproteobacteria bacterium GWA2_38_16]|nr:MAG: hypothetical protein A2Z91_09470 [Deltaproteobacteria bacterium GWA2_38_16]OGQ02476.1 MAG: hypothetical protein A3D19_09260 [Deltaproteobacteria bacterium RIFCSPHIGHO2_02_FULL_38_15]OGQ34424.1 MAG: hypothetical protein A3A72_06075 [Deltaproteobacteria bacterium RIFCSPLOWO2_01_FULL_38_9]OGQ61876.1 MAG: hypothetical protein A3G92_05265 [Deltaproteobacteria bacterium RIFCSPLOWO2_12_FULL_38_8]HBQ21069.1 hypothetical protein [Deltaproteobacteria bacterium]
MVKKSFLIVFFFFNFAPVYAQDEARVLEQPAYVVVGYGGTFEAQNPLMVEPDKQAEVQNQLIEGMKKRLLEANAVLLEWQVKTSFHPTAISNQGKVIPDLYFPSEKEARFLMVPMVFEGTQGNLKEALEFLNQKQLPQGHFKAEEVKEVRYSLESSYGFYNKEQKDMDPFMSTIVTKEKGFADLSVALNDKDKTLDSLVRFYKGNNEYEIQGRHLLRYVAVYFSFVDPSWIQEGYIPQSQILGQALPDGRQMMLIGLIQDAKELEEFLKGEPK